MLFFWFCNAYMDRLLYNYLPVVQSRSSLLHCWQIIEDLCMIVFYITMHCKWIYTSSSILFVFCFIRCHFTVWETSMNNSVHGWTVWINQTESNNFNAFCKPVRPNSSKEWFIHKFGIACSDTKQLIKITDDMFAEILSGKVILCTDLCTCSIVRQRIYH